MRGHGSGSDLLIVDLFRLRLTRVHGVGEALPRSATLGVVADIQLGATAAIQDEQIGSSATVGGPLGFTSVRLPLVEVLRTGGNGRLGCLKNPRTRVWTVRLGPQHPRALGRGRDGEQAAKPGNHDARPAIPHRRSSSRSSSGRTAEECNKAVASRRRLVAAVPVIAI
jgi:hypothetical protein